VGSPADDGGIATGDIILKINLQDIDGIEDYRRIMHSLESQKKAISFHVKRNGRASFVAVKPE
jgi:S1-C subfamily serine protease